MAFSSHQNPPLVDTLASESPLLPAWYSRSSYSPLIPSNVGASNPIDGAEDNNGFPHSGLEISPEGKHSGASCVVLKSCRSDVAGQDVLPSTQDSTLTSPQSNISGGSILDFVPSSDIPSGISHTATNLQTSPDKKLDASSAGLDGTTADPNSDSTERKPSRAPGKRGKAKSKIDRHDSQQASDERSDKDDHPDKPTGRTPRTQHYREKNRIAASKCRARKRQQLQNIESRCSHYAAVNSELRLQVQDLTGELNELRAMASGHRNCVCRVAWYNSSGQAQQLVLNVQASSFERGRAQSSAAC